MMNKRIPGTYSSTFGKRPLQDKPPTPHFTDFADDLMSDPPLCASDLPLNKEINRGMKNIQIDKTREEDFK